MCYEVVIEDGWANNCLQININRKSYKSSVADTLQYQTLINSRSICLTVFWITRVGLLDVDEHLVLSKVQMFLLCIIVEVSVKCFIMSGFVTWHKQMTWVLFYVFQELERCYPLYSWHGQTDTHVNLMFQPRAAAAVCCDWSYLSTPIVRSGPVAVPVALLTTWALSWFLLSPRLKSIFLGWLCLLCFSLIQSSPTFCLSFLLAFHHLA